uniref:ShKT domain-containing protein n=1 Tax=Meloidogyne incognita TaxID=6306 RepID=A0A914MH58_MELIC
MVLAINLSILLNGVNIILFIIIVGANEEPVNAGRGYSNGRFKVYHIKPKSVEQLEGLNRLEQLGVIDFWRPPPNVNSTADVMVDTENGGIEFLNFLARHKMEAKILVDDLSKLIEEKEIIPTERQKLSKLNNQNTIDEKQQQFIRRDSIDNRLDNFGLKMGDYPGYNEIVVFMQRVHDSLTERTILRSIGSTVEGRSIQGIQFGLPSDRSRPVVWIDAGIHAREWTSIHTALYFIYYIANQIKQGTDTRLLKCLEKVDILIFPCLNPDGYEFTRSDPRNPAIRMWRKNRSKERCVTDSHNTERCCMGVDLNRNFAFKFAEGGTSFFPCSEIYHGPNAFSEPESRAVRDAIMEGDLKGRIPGLISMHAYSQLWIYPYSHRRHSYPSDVEDLKAVARRAVTAIGDKFGTNYQYGTGPETIYAYTGGSSDWAKETAKIKYTYTVELRPSFWSWNGFVLDRSQLIPTARETFDGVLVVLETISSSGKTIINNSFGSKRSISPLFPPSQNFNKKEKATKLTSCFDAVEHCPIWIKANPQICNDSKTSMMRECRKSCKFC